MRHKDPETGDICQGSWDDEPEWVPTPASPGSPGTMSTWKVGDYAAIPSATRWGKPTTFSAARWHVKVLEISDDGRFAKVSSGGSRGQLAKPRWIEASRLLKV